MKHFLVFGLTFSLFLVGCNVGEEMIVEGEPYVSVPTIGKKIPQFDNLEGTDGNYHSLSEFEGAALLLMFETVECSYCEKERPSIFKLEEKYGALDKGGQLQIVTISIGEDMEEVLPHVQEKGISHLWLLEGDQFVSITYLANGTPDHFFVDKDGILRARFKGYLEYDILDENVQKLLEYNNN